MQTAADNIRLADRLAEAEVIALYRANGWSSAEKPARIDGRLVGLGNAISDGRLVVYYPHMLVHPDHQRQGVGRAMMAAMLARYAGFHQQMLTADGAAVAFYESLGFAPAGRTQSMWIYAGSEH